MTKGQIKAKLASVDRKIYKYCDKLIAAGMGMLRPSDMRELVKRQGEQAPKLVREYLALLDRHQDLIALRDQDRYLNFL